MLLVFISLSLLLLKISSSTRCACGWTLMQTLESGNTINHYLLSINIFMNKMKENLDVYHPSIRIIGILTLVVGFYYVRAIVKNDTQFLKATGKSYSLLCSNSILSIWKNDLWNLIHLFCIQQTDPQLSGYVWSYRSCISNHHPFYSSSKAQACLNYYSQTFCIESHNISVVSTLYIK